MQTSRNHQSWYGRWDRNNPLVVVNKHFWLEWARTTHSHTVPHTMTVFICPLHRTVFRGTMVESGSQCRTPTHLHQPHRAVETRWLNDSFGTVIPIIATTKTTPTPNIIGLYPSNGWLTRGCGVSIPKTTTQYAYIFISISFIYLCLRKLDNSWQKGKKHISS